MRIATARSVARSATQAAEELAAELGVDTLGAPDFLAVHFSAGIDAEALRGAALARLGTATLHGGSSCLGVMSQAGVDIEGGVGALAIWDQAGDYGVASATLGADAREAARTAATAALTAAGRPGEMPELVWLSVAPGREEEALAGLRDALGPDALIVGGSSADDHVSGGWRQFGPEASHADGVVVSTLFPSAPVVSIYQSGYAPTGESGVVTRVDGRRLYEIDGRSAAEIYGRWTGGAVPAATDAPVSILAAATLWPLGRVTRHVAGVPFHLLAHPAAAHPDGSLDLFADVAVGDRLWQMQGSGDSLVARAGRIARQAREQAGGTVRGALIVYCGGCMLAVRERMHEVRAGVEAALGGAPWLGVFTFGEQGAPLGGRSEHGNLMISCTAFGG